MQFFDAKLLLPLLFVLMAANLNIYSMKKTNIQKNKNFSTKDVDFKPQKKLIMAIRKGFVDFAQYVIKQYANEIDINKPNNNDGKTALHLACENRDKKMVELLLKNGASGSVNKLDKKGNTPYNIVCLNNDGEIFRLFMELVGEENIVVCPDENIQKKKKTKISDTHKVKKNSKLVNTKKKISVGVQTEKIKEKPLLERSRRQNEKIVKLIYKTNANHQLLVNQNRVLNELSKNFGEKGEEKVVLCIEDLENKEKLSENVINEDFVINVREMFNFIFSEFKEDSVFIESQENFFEDFCERLYNGINISAYILKHFFNEAARLDFDNNVSDDVLFLPLLEKAILKEKKEKVIAKEVLFKELEGGELVIDTRDVIDAVLPKGEAFENTNQREKAIKEFSISFKDEFQQGIYQARYEVIPHIFEKGLFFPKEDDLSIVEKDILKKVLQNKKTRVLEYPYDTNKMTYEKFVETEAGKNYKGAGLRNPFMFNKTDILDDLTKIVYKVSPQAIQDLIAECKNMRKSGEYYSKIIVLHGPVGSGKTEMIKLVAKAANRNLSFINSACIGTMYKDSEQINLHEVILNLAKNKLSNIFAVHDADLLTKDCVQVIQKFAKCKNIIFMLETIYPNLMRKKLFDKIDNYCTIKASLPNKNSRREILKYQASKIKLHFDKTLNYDLIAKKTKGFSVRLLKGLTDEMFCIGKMRMIKKGVKDKAKKVNVTVKDFDNAYNVIMGVDGKLKKLLLGEVEN